MSTRQTAIVTGVTGQLGSYYVEYLRSLGYRVYGTVRRTSNPSLKNVKSLVLDPLFSIEQMDLGDSSSISNLINKIKPDYFINAAANSFVGTSWDFPEQHMEFNAMGVLRQLEAMRNHSPKTKYLNMGTSEEFGDVRFSPQTEMHPPCARSPYGASKVAARQLVKVYRESYNLWAVQGWCFNFESPRRGPEFVTRKISLAAADISLDLDLGGEVKPLFLGNLEAKRDWSHALDIVDGTWRMLNQDKFNSNFSKINEYVFSSGETRRVEDFVSEAFACAKIPGQWTGEDKTRAFSNIKYGNLVLVDPKFYRPAEVNLLLGDSSKARNELGWKPKFSFKDIVSEMVNYDQDFRDCEFYGA